MASDLSSGCTDDIEIFDEKEEGEISLEDVSSSEESHPNYRSAFRNGGRCQSCMSLQHCSPWCNFARLPHRRLHPKPDADHGKENRRRMKESSAASSKNIASTLQEKNDDDDLVPISSDSDMEIVGLPGNSKHIASRSSPKSSKVRKKKKKKRSHEGTEKIVETLDPVQTYNLPNDATIKVVHKSRTHNRETLSPRYNVESSIVDKNLTRSPPRRWRTSTRAIRSRSPLRRSRSPILLGNSTGRKVSRKTRSTRKTSSHSPVKFGMSSESRDSLSSPHDDIYATKLLKKVRHLESVGTFSPKDKSSRSKEHSSLKEKLNNMMKNKETIVRRQKISNRVAGSKENDNNNTTQTKKQNAKKLEKGIKDKKEKKDKKVEEEEEDEDVELLRRLALETKQKKNSDDGDKEGTRRKDSESKVEVNLSDDNDSEALELRMIALRSAVMKKHRNRVERGLGSQRARSKNEARTESPFSLSFLEGIPVLDEFSDHSVQSPSSGGSFVHQDERNNIEDMELDTDVEREKDSMPYSPTDDLGQITIDNESPDTQVEIENTNEGGPESILNSTDSKDPAVNKTLNNSLCTDLPSISEGLNSNRSTRTEDENGTTQLPEKSGYTSSDSLANYLDNPDAPYSPSKPMEDSTSASSPSKSTNIETPYSPTDAPIYDPELTDLLSEPSGAPETQKSLDKEELKEKRVQQSEHENSKISINLVPLMLNMSMSDDDASKVGDSTQDGSKKSEVNSQKKIPDFSLIDEERMKTYEAIIDELPEIDLDGSPLVPVTKEATNVDISMPLGITSDVTLLPSEPLYLKGLPNITRDVNIIPTVVNRTLVPVSILKSNKQLQQPLPPKKIEICSESTFKSAEMHPVTEDEITVRSSTTFKPIKLCPILKKPQITIPSAPAFDGSLTDKSNTTVDTQTVPIRDSTEGSSSRLRKEQTVDNHRGRKSEEIIPGKSSSCNERSKSSSCNERSKSSSCNERSKSSSCNERSKSASPLRSKTTNSEKITKNSERVHVASKSLVTKEKKSDKKILNEASGSNNSTRSEVSTEGTITSGKRASLGKTGRKKSTNKSGRTVRSRQKARERVSEAADSASTKNEITKKDQTTPNEESVKNNKMSSETKKGSNVGNQGETKNESEGNEKRKNNEKMQDRRSSLEEDEETLRALLLASLPKRTKTGDATTEPAPANPIAKITRLSETSSSSSGENSAVKSSRAAGIKDSEFPSLSLSSKSSSPADSQTSKTIDPVNPKIVPGRKNLASEMNVSSSSSMSTSPLTPRKRSASLTAKSPPKKIARKTFPVLASTKVVNNAKKYQNTMLQKKLSLQRAGVTYNNNVSRNLTLNNLKNYETSRPISPLVNNSSSKTQRLVINLESDSDSESDSTNDESNVPAGVDAPPVEQRKPPHVAPTIDFEKSVEQFLRDQRKKTESVAASSKTVPANVTSTNQSSSIANSTIVTNVTKSSASPAPGSSSLGIYSTPLAVRRHLPVSQQNEYRRLKQQIMERERQMLQKTIEKSPSTPPGPLSPSSSIAATLTRTVQPQKSSADKSMLPPSKDVLKAKVIDSANKANVTKAPNSKLIADNAILNSLTPNSKSSNLSNDLMKAPIPKTASSPIAQTSGSAITSAATKIVTNNPGQMIKNNAARMKENVTDPKNASNVSRNKVIASNVQSTGNVTPTSASLVGSENSGSVTLSKSLIRGSDTLTIEIPNDRIAKEKSVSDPSTSTGEINENLNNAPKNTRVLKILTTEQLNSKFVKIQIQKGMNGRKVTVPSKATISDSNSSIKPSSSNNLLEDDNGRLNRIENCDDLSFNDNDETKRNEKLHYFEENSTEISEASTLVLSTNQNTDDSTSTVIQDRSDSRTCEDVESIALSSSEEGTTKKMHSTNQNKEIWNKIRSDVSHELEVIGGLSTNEQKKMLLKTQDNLLSKRSMILEELTELSGSVRQWEFEREIHTKLIAEVRRLREQLKLAEGRLCEQRHQMNEIGSKVTKTHEKINHDRRECYKLSRICHGLGTHVIGQNYKVPSTGARLLSERLKEVAMHTRQLATKKVSVMVSPLNRVDVVSSSPIASIPPSEGNSSNSCETVNHIALPSTSISDIENEEDDHEPDETAANEDEPSVIILDDSIVEKTDADRNQSEEVRPVNDYTDERRDRQTNEQSVSKEDGANDQSEERIDLISGTNDSICVIETPDVLETESNNLKTTDERKNEDLSSGSPNCPTSEIVGEGSDSSKTNEISTEEDSSIRASDVDVSVDPLIETGKSSDRNNTAIMQMSREMNVISIVPDASDECQAENVLSVAGTSRSESPSFRLLNHSQSMGKRKLDQYNSVLSHLKIQRNENPDGILCPYELMGTCNDGDCQYYHIDPDRQCQ